MNPHLTYRQSTANAWTRIDMLLLVYEHVIEALDRGIHILETEDHTELIMARVDAQKKILLLADGLDVDQDQIAANVLNLCVFILDQIQTDSLDAWQTSVKLIETVHEGFQSIADEARALERSGQIPSLGMS